MYFSPEQARKTVRNLYHSLVDGGWLIVSPCELSSILFSQFVAVHFADAIFYRKECHPARKKEFSPSKIDEKTIAAISSHQEAPCESPIEIESPPVAAASPPAESEKAEISVCEEASWEKLACLFEQGCYSDVEAELNYRPSRPAGDAQEMALLARACANQGKLQPALEWCEKAVAANRIDAGLHYLRSMILQEQGNIEESIASLKRALYLDPQFALAYFALGNIARRQGNLSKSNKYFENAVSLLSAYGPDDALPESDGITAGRLLEIIRSTIGMEGWT